MATNNSLTQPIRLYALVELGDPETIDLFFTEEEAESARWKVVCATSRSGAGCCAVSQSSSMRLCRTTDDAPRGECASHRGAASLNEPVGSAAACVSGRRPGFWFTGRRAVRPSRAGGRRWGCP